MFPVEMLFMRTTVLLFILTATAGALTFITLYYIPLYFQFTRVNNLLLLFSKIRVILLFKLLYDYYLSFVFSCLGRFVAASFSPNLDFTPRFTWSERYLG
jgi:hypothetical protein